MSTLEKTIGLLETMPDNKIETVYAFVRFINSDIPEPSFEPTDARMETIRSMIGIAHEYADPKFSAILGIFCPNLKISTTLPQKVKNKSTKKATANP